MGNNPVLYYLFDINDLDKPKIENSIYFIRNKSIGFMIWTTPPIERNGAGSR